MTVSIEEKQFIGGLNDAKLPAKKRAVKPRTIAQSIRRSSDPYRASITSFSRREVIRSEDGRCDKKIFFFEDGSFLAFEVTYSAIEDGVSE